MDKLETAEKLIAENARSKNQILDLSNLNLSTIPESAFSLHHLRTLSLTNNKIHEMQPRILELHNLEILGMNYNELVVIPNWVGKLLYIKSLDFWKNKIETLPVELGELERLEYLTLGFNRLKYIPSQLFVFLSRLKSLDLQNNPFSEMPIIRDMEIFDLMAYFRNQSAFYGYIEMPKELTTAFQQFFNFFPEFVSRTSGHEINMEVTKTKNGLKFTTFETDSLKIETINTIFKQFMQSVDPSIGIDSQITPTSSQEAEILKLEMKLQISHLKNQIEILSFENKFLKETVRTVTETQHLIAKNPTVVTILPAMNEEIYTILKQLREQVIGHESAEKLVEELAEEVEKKDTNTGKIKTITKKLYEKAPGVAAVLAILTSLLGL